jgi:hypothetical protein
VIAIHDRAVAMRKFGWCLLSLLGAVSWAVAPASASAPAKVDPMVQEFLTRAETLGIYFLGYEPMLKLPFAASAFAAKVKELGASIESESLPDKVEFTDEILHDRDGVEKPAVFNHETGLIRLNRAAWNLFGGRRRLVQVMMEISGLLKVPLRYETADHLASAEYLEGDVCEVLLPAFYESPENLTGLCAERQYSAARCDELRGRVKAWTHRRAEVCAR